MVPVTTVIAISIPIMASTMAMASIQRMASMKVMATPWPTWCWTTGAPARAATTPATLGTNRGTIGTIVTIETIVTIWNTVTIRTIVTIKTIVTIMTAVTTGMALTGVWVGARGVTRCSSRRQRRLRSTF